MSDHDDAVWDPTAGFVPNPPDRRYWCWGCETWWVDVRREKDVKHKFLRSLCSGCRSGIFRSRTIESNVIQAYLMSIDFKCVDCGELLSSLNHEYKQINVAIKHFSRKLRCFGCLRAEDKRRSSLVSVPDRVCRECSKTYSFDQWIQRSGFSKNARGRQIFMKSKTCSDECAETARVKNCKINAKARRI